MPAGRRSPLACHPTQARRRRGRVVPLLGVRKRVNRTRSDCRTLIVEDDAGSREALAAFLRRRGYAVECAATVAAGRAKLTEDVTHLILDLRLPEGTGLRPLGRAHEQRVPLMGAAGPGPAKG